jgi:solute carrier family 13 (sodium-dependent dicarboxylate transporter), member 2/3/5
MPGRPRRVHEITETVEAYSPAEELFNRRRRTVGLVLAPVALLALLALPSSLPPPAHRLGAILVTMIVLWITEALPMAVTAMLGPLLAVILQVADARTALASFADPIIFLFIGSFMLAEAMFVHGLDRRIAFTALASRLVHGHGAGRIIVVYAAVCAGLSMWLSNTATTAMMYPIGLSLAAQLTGAGASKDDSRRFAMVIMLVTAFSASIGGLGTPIGTPPNLIGLAMLDRLAGHRITFTEWMAFAVPLMVAQMVFMLAYFQIGPLRGVRLSGANRDLLREELRRLGPVSPAQRNIMIAFGITVVLWLVPGVFAIVGGSDWPAARAYNAHVPESIAALVGAVLLFLLPVDWKTRRFTLTWDEAARIDWGVILLFGGGLAMGELAFSTGLAPALGKSLMQWIPGQGALSLIVVFTAVSILATEVTSNTAAANIVVPIAIASATASGVNPVGPALGATLGASLAFMLPVSTPPNAIVYSSGHVPITSMIRYGIILDVVGFVLIVALLSAVSGWLG